MIERKQTLIQWITAAEKETGETVTDIFLEKYEDYRDDTNEVNRRMLTRQQFETDPWATKKFYAGFGGAGCPAIVAWTPNWIMYVSEYDGSTSLSMLPRNPVTPTRLHYGDVH